MKPSSIQTETLYRIWIAQSEVIKEFVPEARIDVYVPLDVMISNYPPGTINKVLMFGIKDDAMSMMDIPGYYEKLYEYVRIKVGFDISTIVKRKSNLIEKIINKNKIFSKEDYYFVKYIVDDLSNRSNPHYQDLSRILGEYEVMAEKSKR